MTILKTWNGVYGVCGRCANSVRQCEARNAQNGVRDTFVCKNAHVNFIPFNK